MSTPEDRLTLLAPASVKAGMDRLQVDVQAAAGRRLNRREALGVFGLALLAGACGTSTGASSAPSGGGSGLAGRPLENHLEIYNWAQYDDPSTYTKFMKLPAETKAHLTIHETYYSSNDELLAKINAGAGSYDIIVPTQNAVAQLISEGKLMKLDKSLLPNLAHLDPSFLKPTYDPTGDYHVIKDFGITTFFYNHKIVSERPQAVHEFYELLPKYAKKGRTNLLDGANEVVPNALMAIGLDPNTAKTGDFASVQKFLLSIRSGVTTIDASSYINDAMAGKIILGQGWSGDIRRIIQARKKEGDITGVIPTGVTEIWADNWCIPATAPHPVAAHAWINWLCTPSTAVTEMLYHNYKIPMPAALAQLPATLREDPLFNVPKSHTDNYKYILDPTPAVVQQRNQVYETFVAA